MAVQRALGDRLSREPELELVGNLSGHCAEDVIEWIHIFKPDVVLLESKRRDGYGLRLCQLVLELEQNPEIIVLTSFDDDDERLATQSLGVRHYLLKEIASPELLGEIRAAYTERDQRIH